MIVVDDELKPDVAVVGPIFSNVLGAIEKPVTDGKVFLISPNAGSSVLAGKGCNPFFLATSYQNDQVHQVSGKVAQDRAYRTMYLVAPNYQAGKDAMAGFKRDYRGEVVEESYIPLNTLDFQSELSKIASMKPDAVYAFLPGGMGVNFIKQYRQASLADRIPVFSASTVDESTLPAQGEAALGMFSGSNWAANLDNPANRNFVSTYVSAYNAVPASYAVHAYDAAMDKDALRIALMRADFTSLRGSFAFGANGFPVQDFYLTRVGRRGDGKYETQVVEKVFSNFADPYARDCAAK